MLSRNICVGVGLANGSIGSIIEIVKFDSLEDDDYNKIDDILVRFPIYTGRIFIHDMPDVIPILELVYLQSEAKDLNFLFTPLPLSQSTKAKVLRSIIYIVTSEIKNLFRD